jgi:hypothetical protein
MRQIQLAFRLFVVCRMFLFSLTLRNIPFLTRSDQLIFWIRFQHKGEWWSGINAHSFWALTLDRFCQLSDPKIYHRGKELPALIKRRQLGPRSRSGRRKLGRKNHLLWRNRTQNPRSSNPQPSYYTEWATLDPLLKMYALQNFRL